MIKPAHPATLLLATVLAMPAFGSTDATREDAVAMVKKAVAFIKAQGAERGTAAISDRDSPSIDRGLYLAVYGLDGKCLAHGDNPRQIGRDLIEQNATLVEESAAAAESLRHQAQQLGATVSSFRLANAPEGLDASRAGLAPSSMTAPLPLLS
ncbi:MAG: hypothetical protein ACK5WT_02850 [Betaproteobacteria bacterium]